MSDSNARPVGCPVCRTHTEQDAWESESFVLGQVEALVKRDDANLIAGTQAGTPYDLHTAVSLLAQAMLDICRLTGTSLSAALAHYRKVLNDELATEDS